MLYPIPRSDWRRLVLHANRSQLYYASLVNGIGFVLEENEAVALLKKDAKNRDVIFRYMNGKDLNSTPDQTGTRFIINFFDWSLERAAEYPECLAIVVERVRPIRQELPDSKARVRGNWWRYEYEAASLYHAISGMSRVIAITSVSKAVTPAFSPPDQVFAHTVYVFACDDDFHFGVLTSGFHYRWAARYSSTLETRIRYTPSDVFETFPQPDLSETVASAGKALHEHRSQLMVTNNEGLTATYNRVHDQKDETPGIPELRELHVALDLAVRDAYGWDDLDLGHGFHPVRGQGIRFTFSPAGATEVLERLLELNKARYEAEVAAGLHAPEAKRGRRQGARRPKSAENSTPSLFGDTFAGSAPPRGGLAP